MFVEPRHRQFQRLPGMEAGRARVGEGRSLGLGGGLEDGGPFGLEEGEVGCHLNSSKARPKNQIKTTKTNNISIIHNF